MGINVDKVLVSLLETNIPGVKVWALEKPKEAAVPALVYKRVSSRSYVYHGGQLDVVRDWIQITHVASTYAELRTLVDNVEAQLIGNTTNFSVSLPSDTHVEFKEDTLYFANRDYFIFYKK